MPDLKLRQIKYEIETCKWLLNFITDENVYLKNRLAEVVKESFEINMLAEMEIYLGKSLAQDEYVNLLRNDVAKIEQRLWAAPNEESEIVNYIYPNVRLLRSNILKTEALAIKLFEEFNNFISQWFMSN